MSDVTSAFARPTRLCCPFLLILFTFSFRVIAAPFTNGSFELPHVLDGSKSNYYVFLPAGDAGLSAWTIGGTNTAPGVLGSGITRVNGLIQDLDFLPTDGDYQLIFNDANRVSGDWVLQEFDTVPGETYIVGFQVGRRGTGTGNLSMTATALSATGKTLGTRTATPPGQGYGPQEWFAFTAATESTILKIQDLSEATINVDITLDNVTVTRAQAVQEPTLRIAVKTVEVSMTVILGVTYQLESTKNFETWSMAGPPFQAQQAEISQEFDVLETGRYFRLKTIPQFAALLRHSP